MLRKFLGTAIALAALTSTALSADIKPAVVYDLGGKFDKSFNESAYRGAERFAKEYKIAYRDFELQNDSQREQALRNFARRGFNPIVAVGFSNKSALEKVAKEFPNVKFAIIDDEVKLENVRSIKFKEEEGSYLVGMLAMMSSKTGKIGFIGGMDITLIRRFACGYVQGGKAIKKDGEVLQKMIGTTGAAWNDPARGGEIAKAQFASGVDVVYHAAGGSGKGVLQAANEAGKLGIGVDSNQNHLFPGSVLTSMVKAVDVAVFKAFEDAKNDKWTSGLQQLGLKEGGVSWSLDKHNDKLVTADMRKRLADAQKGIIDGTIKVHNYSEATPCPF